MVGICIKCNKYKRKRMKDKIKKLEYDFGLDACITKHAPITAFNLSVTEIKRSGLDIPFVILSIQTYPYKFFIV